MRGWWLSALLLASSCKDPGLERLSEASREYQRLVEARTVPSDRAYDAVLDTLNQISPRSPAHRQAQQLRRAIQAGRASAPQRPLARPTTALGSLESDVEAQGQQCVRLVEALGRAGPQERDGLTRELARCQKRLGELEEAHHHSDGH